MSKAQIPCRTHSSSRKKHPTEPTFVALLKACTSQKDLERGCELYAEIARTELLQNDAFIGSSLVNMFAKCSSLAKAQEVFDNLHARSVVSWTALIAGYVEHGHGIRALSCVKQMEREGINPDSHTYVCSLKACGNIGAIDEGQELHMEIASKGLERELFIGNALVDLYARNGLLETAQELLNTLPVRDVVTWNALITGYVEHGLVEKVFHCFEQMHHEGVPLDAITLVCGLRACGIMVAAHKGQELHLEIAQKGLEIEILVGNALVDMYTKCCLLESAQKVFDELPIQDVITWTALLAGYAEHGYSEGALHCFEQMRHRGIILNEVSFVCALKACSSIRDMAKGQEIHTEMVKKGLEGDLLVGNSLVDMYVKCGLLATAQEVFDKLPLRDVVLWNVLIAGYSEHGLNEEALNCFERMQQECSSLNSTTFIFILKACCGVKALTKGWELHAGIIVRGLEKELFVGSALVEMYGKCGFLEEARHVLVDGHMLQNMVSQNALMVGYAQHTCGEEALDCFDQIQRNGASLDVATYVYSLKACGSIGALVKGQEIHAEVVRKGLEFKLIVGGILVDMYAKCGLLQEVQEVFAKLSGRDLLSWNALIAAYSQLGERECTFKAFAKMLGEGMQPDLVTFVSILNACSHAGRITEAQMYFSVFFNDHGLIPMLEHYNCMIDLMGRAGHMEKVVVIIETMPWHPDVIVWHTVMSACQKWGNVKLGMDFFEHVMLLDDKDVGACVSMLNIYADAFVDAVHRNEVIYGSG